MNKDEKDFNIPRGTDEEYNAIRDSLRKRINNYEANMPKQNVVPDNYVKPAHSNVNFDKPQENFVNQKSSFNQNPFDQLQKEDTRQVHQPAHTAGHQGSLSFQQYQSSLNQNASDGQQTANHQTNTNIPWTTPNHGRKSPFDTPQKSNSSQNQISFDNIRPSMATASHSNEPIVYKPKQRKSAGKTVVFLIAIIAVIFGLSFLLREFVFQAYEIPSGSMERTIMTGDMVFAEKVSYRFTNPKPGDIITFNDPLNDSRILIKRVIATEGQVVDIKNNKLYIDGVEQKEDYVNNLPTTTLRPKDPKLTYPYTVPDGQIWVMGDNRTNSQDSRYFGSIPVDSVIGQALVVYWPISNTKNLI